VPATRRPHNVGVAVERSDVPLRLVGVLAAGLAVFLAVSALAIMAIFPGALSGPSDAPRLATAKPRLQIDPTAELADYRARQTQELTSYGWVDRPRGVVRIPIERAMQDVATAGIKDWPGGAQ
jgi:hypothetical protein